MFSLCGYFTGRASVRKFKPIYFIMLELPILKYNKSSASFCRWTCRASSHSPTNNKMFFHICQSIGTRVATPCGHALHHMSTTPSCPSSTWTPPSEQLQRLRLCHRIGHAKLNLSLMQLPFNDPHAGKAQIWTSCGWQWRWICDVAGSDSFNFRAGSVESSCKVKLLPFSVTVSHHGAELVNG